MYNIYKKKEREDKKMIQFAIILGIIGFVLIYNKVFEERIKKDEEDMNEMRRK